MRTRASGMEFAVGAYLGALGIGIMIPRPGLGLYSLIHEGGDQQIWFVLLIASALALMIASYQDSPAARISAVILAMLCWTALELKFIEAALWGAMLQACVSIGMLFYCLLQTLRSVRTVWRKQA